MDPEEFKRQARRTADEARSGFNKVFEQMRQKQAEGQQKYEKWQKE